MEDPTVTESSDTLGLMLIDAHRNQGSMQRVCTGLSQMGPWDKVPTFNLIEKEESVSSTRVSLDI